MIKQKDKNHQFVNEAETITQSNVRLQSFREFKIWKTFCFVREDIDVFCKSILMRDGICYTRVIRG